MITILDERKTLQQLANDNTNGKGVLFPIEANIVEDLNGVYELNFKITLDEKRYDELKIGGVVRCRGGETEGNQLFRIIEISKERNGIISVYAQHISYDLNKLVVRPFTSIGINNICNDLISNTIANNGFTIQTDIVDTETEFKTEIPRSFRTCLGGFDGSILKLFNCEFKWDNLQVSILSRRGVNTNVRIAYGKNLVDLKQDENIEKTYNSVIGYASYREEEEYEEEGETKKEVVTKYLTGDMQYIETTNYPKSLIVDFSKEFDNDNLPTVERLNELALEYATNNAINVPKVSLKVSFVALWQTNEYKDFAPLEMVELGDIVKVDFPKLKVSANARVVKRIWNVLTERYDSLELGDAPEDLASMFSNTYTSITNLSNTTNKISNEADTALLIANSKQNKLTAGTNIQITNDVISATGTQYTAGNNIQINGNVISATDTTYTGGTGINISSGHVISVKDEYVKLVGDTMSGELTIEKASGQTMFRTKRTDNNYDIGFGVGSSGKMGVYDFKNAKWVLQVNEADNTIRMAGTINITGNSASKPLRVRNIVGSNGTVTDGPLYLNYGNANVIYLGETGAYNISADGKTYSGHLAYSTTTITGQPSYVTGYDNHGKIERYGAICFLDLNFYFNSGSSIGFNIGTIPTGYRPKLKHTVNVQVQGGIGNGDYIAVNTNGTISSFLAGGAGQGTVRAIISYICDY